eukprot:SM000427S15759  [mRNA]  locus=s427:33855:34043:- [translate_table: standard]
MAPEVDRGASGNQIDFCLAWGGGFVSGFGGRERWRPSSWPGRLPASCGHRAPPSFCSGRFLS